MLMIGLALVVVALNGEAASLRVKRPFWQCLRSGIVEQTQCCALITVEFEERPMPLHLPKYLTEAEMDDMLRLAEQAGFLVEITGQ